MDLTIGRSGAEVTALQKFLINRGHSIPAGATGYFGGQTQTALASFQASQGIAPAAGYFGPVTRGKVNLLCTTTVPPGNNGGNPPTTGGENPLTGEATLERYDAKSGDDTNLSEGQKNAVIMDASFRVKDGDVRINRVDLAMRPANTNNEKDPWDVFNEISIYDGSTRLARIDASDQDNWEEDAPTNGDYRLRMTGLNWVLRDGKTANLTVKATVANSVKGTNDGESWDVFIPTNGIRGMDGDNASVYTGDSADSVSVDIDQAGSQDEIAVKRSDEDPNATTLQLKSNKSSGWTTVFAFDLDTDNSTNDIDVRKIPVKLTVGSGTVNTFMRDARLVVDGTTYTKKTVTDGSTNTMLFEIDKGDLTIDAGDRVTVEVQVDFKALAPSNEGTTITGSVDTAGIVAKGADTLTGSQLSGSATGETHTMRTQGAVIAAQSTSVAFKANSSNTKDDDAGSYSITFDVTAFDGDIFIPKFADRGTSLGTAGANFVIEDMSNGGNAIASGTAVSSLASKATSEGSFFKVPEGETKSFTLTVEYDPDTSSFYALRLHSVNWNTSASAPSTMQLALPTSAYETAPLSI